LAGIGLAFNNLAGGNFADQNLSTANFSGATLSGADFTGAEIRSANFEFRVSIALGGGGDLILRGPEVPPTGTAITLAQLYSTASYQAKDLSGIGLRHNDLAGGNFAGQNLSNADFGGANLTDANFRQANLANAKFSYIVSEGCSIFFCFPVIAAANLTDADLTAADARGATFQVFFPSSGFSAANTANLIWPDGHIDGLDLDDGGQLFVRDYDGNSNNNLTSPVLITIDQHLAMGQDGTLRMVFDADDWDSTISFAPGIPVSLGGTLELIFADDVHLGSQIGRTFDLFDWTSVNPVGAFAISSPYAWDLSNLYATGEVTLIAIPEPCAFVLFGVGLNALLAIGRLRLSCSCRKGEN
jgi:uncharacterized protein YjbI with pentapeptide repeats